ncbi:terpene cyclase/mutase family protein, partial [Planctomycetota bacterium]|nr:terpene cyclase/mutase family protein [Planctomycetota bacterium]
SLEWLSRHQSSDGRWDSDGWAGSCDLGHCSGPGDNNGDARYDVGLTGLALLAFLGDGHTHTSDGPYKGTVARGLHWLASRQADDGSLGFDRGETIYNHAIAAQALCEAYGLTGDAELQAPARAAVDWILAAQNPGLGWKYGVRSGRNDTSVTSWMVHALVAGQAAGFYVPDEAFGGAQRWFQRATDTQGHTGYETPGGGSAFLAPTDGKYDPVPVCTAASLTCRYMLGDRPDLNRRHPLRLGPAILLENLPRWEPGNVRRANFYYWYWAALAAKQADQRTWTTWNRITAPLLQGHQRGEGCESGSWDPVDEWCLAGGRVYATAINALTLQAPYRVPKRGQ